MTKRTILLLAAMTFLFPCLAWTQINEDANHLAREIFKQLIEMNTTNSGGTTTAAQAMAERLLAAGFPARDVMVKGPNARKGNLVARIHGTGRLKPILLLAHLDVVEARREDWTTNPFQFIEKDGYFYGRGTVDIKDGDAILVANFIRLKKEGFKPNRDLILALTADEEGGTANGVDWLLKSHRDWIDADYCVNLDGGDFMSEQGKRIYTAVQASEKVYLDFQLEVKNPGGHSSRPIPDNAIYHLAAGLTRLASFEFPVQLNEVTRSMLDRSAAFQTGQVAADMKAVTEDSPSAAAVARLSHNAFYNALLRTTCVATRLDAGHANNALPQTARASVNCRILPGQPPQQIRQTLAKVLADPQIQVTFVESLAADGTVLEPKSVPPSPLRPDVIGGMERVVSQMYPGLSVIPVMDTGASDGRFLRMSGIPTYGISGVFLDLDNRRAHGRDERLRVTDFYDGVEFNYQLIKALSSGK